MVSERSNHEMLHVLVTFSSKVDRETSHNDCIFSRKDGYCITDTLPGDFGCLFLSAFAVIEVAILAARDCVGANRRADTDPFEVEAAPEIPVFLGCVLEREDLVRLETGCSFKNDLKTGSVNELNQKPIKYDYATKLTGGDGKHVQRKLHRRSSRL